jgi:hypothetical protein
MAFDRFMDTHNLGLPDPDASIYMELTLRETGRAVRPCYIPLVIGALGNAKSWGKGSQDSEEPVFDSDNNRNNLVHEQ